MPIPLDVTELPPFGVSRVFTEWGIDPYLFVGTVWVAGLYLLGVWTLRSRGDHWPPGRTAAFLVGGVGSFYFATESGLATYDTTLLSAHMVQHMILSMVVPLFLALGAPVTLALRTLGRRPRGWLLAVLHSRAAKVLTFAPLTLALYVVSPWALYFTNWYTVTLHSNYQHEIMHVHLVLVGCLFFWPILGVDPLPGKMTHPFRLLVIFLSMPFHAFLGVTVMEQTRLIGGDWYPSLHALDAVAARPGRRPEPRRRHPVGLRRPDRAGLLRRPVHPVGACFDAGGPARGPPAGHPRAPARPRRWVRTCAPTPRNLCEAPGRGLVASPP